MAQKPNKNRPSRPDYPDTPEGTRAFNRDYQRRYRRDQKKERIAILNLQDHKITKPTKDAQDIAEMLCDALDDLYCDKTMLPRERAHAIARVTEAALKLLTARKRKRSSQSLGLRWTRRETHI